MDGLYLSSLFSFVGLLVNCTNIKLTYSLWLYDKSQYLIKQVAAPIFYSRLVWILLTHCITIHALESTWQLKTKIKCILSLCRGLSESVTQFVPMGIFRRYNKHNKTWVQCFLHSLHIFLSFLFNCKSLSNKTFIFIRIHIFCHLIVTPFPLIQL